MSFLTTAPAELAAAAAQLQAIVSSLAAENAGAAAATTVIAPAAADPVSIRQAGIFSAYGTQYQTEATQSQTTQENYTTTLGQSSGTYSSTEASNAANNALQATKNATSNASSDPPGSLLGSLYGFLSGNGLFQGSGGPSIIGQDEAGNWASAYSDTIGMGGGGLLSAIAAPADAGGDLAGLAGATDLAGTTAPAVGSVGMGAMPVAAGMGQATMVGQLSAPPSWAGTVTTVSSVTPTTALSTAGWTAAAPAAGPGTIIPGMPGMGAAARNSAGFGAPRYGVKPIVMPKVTAV
jgi:hypothetical protein